MSTAECIAFQSPFNSCRELTHACSCAGIQQQQPHKADESTKKGGRVQYLYVRSMILPNLFVELAGANPDAHSALNDFHPPTGLLEGLDC